MKMLVLLLLSSSFFLLSSCKKIHDVPAFTEGSQYIHVDEKTGHTVLMPNPICMEKIKEPYCGIGYLVISQKEIIVGNDPKNFYNGKPWDQLKKESVLLPAQESYGPLSADLINLCKDMDCNDKITKFKVKVDSSDAVKEAIKKSKEKEDDSKKIKKEKRS